MYNQRRRDGGELRGYRREERMAEKWCREWHKLQTLKKGWETHQHKKWQGITSMKVGPPTFLEAEAQSKWKAEIIKVLRDCVRDFWIPCQDTKLTRRWAELRNVLVKNMHRCSSLAEEEDGYGELKAVSKGIRNVISRQSISDVGEKGGIRDGIEEGCNIPPPPLQHVEQKVEGEVPGQGLKRGVSKAAVNSQFRVWEELGSNVDSIDIIARGLYGCRKRENLVYSNIIKYMDIVYEGGNRFKSRQVYLKDGGSRRINTYMQYRQLLYRQKIWVGREEYRIITLLYQVQIRIFKEGNKNGRSNVVCIEEIGHNYGRVVDLVHKQGEWAALYVVEDWEGQKERDCSRMGGVVVEQEEGEKRRGRVDETEGNIEYGRIGEVEERKGEQKREVTYEVGREGEVGRTVAYRTDRESRDRHTTEGEIDGIGDTIGSLDVGILDDEREGWETDSDKSSIDLLDKNTLQRFREECRRKQAGIDKQSEKEADRDKAVERKAESLDEQKGEKREYDNGDEIDSDRSSIELIDKNMLQRVWEERRQKDRTIDKNEEERGKIGESLVIENEIEIAHKVRIEEGIHDSAGSEVREGKQEDIERKRRGPHRREDQVRKEARVDETTRYGLDKNTWDIGNRGKGQQKQEREKRVVRKTMQGESTVELYTIDRLERSIGEKGKQTYRREETKENLGKVGRQEDRVEEVANSGGTYKREVLKEVEAVNEVESDESSVDLIDRNMLDRCMEECSQLKEVEVVDEVESDESSVDLIDRNMLDRCMEECSQQKHKADTIKAKQVGMVGKGEGESESRKSSIDLLDKNMLERFREEHMQQEQKIENNREEVDRADYSTTGDRGVELDESPIDLIDRGTIHRRREEKERAVGERYKGGPYKVQGNITVEEIERRFREMSLGDRSGVQSEWQNKGSIQQHEGGERKTRQSRNRLDRRGTDSGIEHSTQRSRETGGEAAGGRHMTQSNITWGIEENGSNSSRSIERREGSRDKQGKQDKVGEKIRLNKKGRQRRENQGEDSRRERDGGRKSSIEALFVYKHLEREGKKVGERQVTRRMVWERWRGIVRGASRRADRRKSKIGREAEEQKEENKVVFDYTTKGLTAEEVRLLGKGEAFCVVDHKIDEDRNRVDIYQYQRRLRLHEAFRDPGEKEEGEVEEIRTPVAGTRNESSRRGRGIGSTISRSGRNTIGRGGRRSINNNSREGEGRERSQNRGGIHRGTDRERGGRTTVGGINNEHHNIVSSIRDGVARNAQGRSSIVYTGTTRAREARTGITQSTEGRRIDTPGLNRRRSRVSNIQGNVGREGTRNVEEGSTNILNREETEERVGRHLPSIYDPDSHNRNLHRYNNCIQEEISLVMEGKEVEFKDNITREERKALKALKQRIAEKEIIITRADKGSGLVAVDYDKYIEKGTKYIEEEAGAYSRVQETAQSIIGRLTKERNKIAELLKERGVIELQTATYVKKQLEEKITGIKFFYKIHKDRRIESMPLRPLQSCIKAPTQHLSIVLTDILQPLLTDKNIPSFIFDSNQLLFRLRKLGKIPNDCTLISSDVSALYPSIPHQEGFRAMRSFLGDRTTYNSQQIDSMIRALELVITENFMTWNRQIYKQVSGVAMGTPVAVAYANIFMNWVDIEVREKAPFIYEHIRYIDDNLFILPEDRVEELMGIANNILPPHIKFTYEKLQPSAEKGLPFLDTQLFIGEDKSIESRLYTKATDRHAYLLPSSYHPPHITRNIPLAVFGRLRKICSREEWFEEDAKKAEGWLENRGYKKEGIQKALVKTRLKDRWSMIEQIEKNRDKKIKKKEETAIDIPFIMTYNQHAKKIRQILRDRQPLLDSAFKKTKVRPRLSYRRKRNLNDIIVQKGLRGPIEESSSELNIFSKCGEKPGYRTRCPCKGIHSQVECRCCIHSMGAIDNVDSKLYKPVNCNSRNIVYIIECRDCKKKYVGETQQRLKDRLAQHMYNVDKLNQPLYLHFRSVHKLERLGIGIVETVRGVEPFMRKVREAWWVNHLKTLEPDGFNVKLECNQVYEGTR